jgi:hypothetical protein
MTARRFALRAESAQQASAKGFGQADAKEQTNEPPTEDGDITGAALDSGNGSHADGSDNHAPK